MSARTNRLDALLEGIGRLQYLGILMVLVNNMSLLWEGI